MGKRIFYLLAALLALSPAAGTATAGTPEFYEGKTIRIVVGFGAGGGFDTYSRTIARHIGKHIPGNPTVIVENMTGAGGLIAANHLYKVAKPDGLTIANVIGDLFLAQRLGRQGIEFDALKFEYLGVPAKDHPVCTLTKRSGITSMEKWMASATPVKLGGVAPGATSYDHPRILQAALGLPIQVVGGYKGTAEIRLASESGEIAGGCGWGWDAVRATWAKAVESGDVVVVVQVTQQPHAELSKVPLAISFAKTAEARQLIQAAIHDMSILVRPYLLPPGTPKERVQLLRKAFTDTMKDREYMADAKKSRLDVDPLTGEEVEGIVAGLFRLSPSVVGKIKEVLK